MAHVIKTLKLLDNEGNHIGKRRFALAHPQPVVLSAWHSNQKTPSCSDETWKLQVWQRIEDRGYVAFLEAGGRHHFHDEISFIGTGETAEAALLDAWAHDKYSDECCASTQFISVCRVYDCETHPPGVE